VVLSVTAAGVCHTEAAQQSGFFHAPTILTGVSLSSRIQNDEPFGPVAFLSCFDTIDEAIAEANRLPYGLAAYGFTSSIRNAQRLQTELETGMLNIRDPEAVRSAHAEIMAAAATRAPDTRITGTLVARQMAGGVECFMGINRDPTFGPVAVFGLGGIFVEILKDVAVRQCPFGEAEAREMILSIRASAILEGARGRPPADVAALAAMLSCLSRFAMAAGPELRSIDLNPVLALPQGQGAYALDAVVEIAGPAQGGH